VVVSHEILLSGNFWREKRKQREKNYRSILFCLSLGFGIGLLFSLFVPIQRWLLFGRACGCVLGVQKVESATP